MLSRGNRDIGVAFQSHPVGYASSRVEAKDTRRSNQSILKEIIPEYSLEGLMLKLKLQYFDYLI